MIKNTFLTLAALAMSTIPTTRAHACGGFFCNTQPVDQSAERIIFVANPDDTVTMAVQITYDGSADEFAWILPLGEVPDPESLDVLHTSVFGTVEGQTSPVFVAPEDCNRPDRSRSVSFDSSAPNAGSPGGVDVAFTKNVGPFTAAAVESEDPAALVAWLKENGYRVTPVMEPFIELYTKEGKKFLALKLQDSKDVQDIQPFAFTLPGQAPSIPLRMTAIAAEPEMGLIIHIFGDMRFGPANWPDIEVKGSDIPWVANEFGGVQSVGYFSTVAKKIDEEGGLGWVTEFAGSAENIRSQLTFNGDPNNEWIDEDVREGHRKLAELIGDAPYATRLYARLSAEEMKSDPIFRRTAGDDVARTVQLTRYVGGRDMCPWFPRNNPCDVVTCGAAGTCRPAIGDNGSLVASCACLPGASARNAVSSNGTASTVCQDQRVSFVNPGDRQSPTDTPLADPCAGFSCGEGGECVAVNMRPTCVCAKGRVALGAVENGTGLPTVSCESPQIPVYDAFYDGSLPPIMEQANVREIQAMPGDRLPQDVITDDGCSVNRRAPSRVAFGLLLLVGIVFARRRRT